MHRWLCSSASGCLRFPQSSPASSTSSGSNGSSGHKAQAAAGRSTASSADDTYSGFAKDERQRSAFFVRERELSLFTRSLIVESTRSRVVMEVIDRITAHANPTLQSRVSESLQIIRESFSRFT